MKNIKKQKSVKYKYIRFMSKMNSFFMYRELYDEDDYDHLYNFYYYIFDAILSFLIFFCIVYTIIKCFCQNPNNNNNNNSSGITIEELQRNNPGCTIIVENGVYKVIRPPIQPTVIQGIPAIEMTNMSNVQPQYIQQPYVYPNNVQQPNFPQPPIVQPVISNGIEPNIVQNVTPNYNQNNPQFGPNSSQSSIERL